ncbi:MAG: cell division protein ZapE [Alphaproteobacteria bacterium]|nr:cell division protein ZapE [Alphaproteobacteria bacterium]
MPQAKPHAFLIAYEQALRSDTLHADAAQRKVAQAFDRLYGALLDATPRKRRFWQRRLAPTPHAQGLYVSGAVGRGKSMLMDLFVATIHPHYPTRRVHFHAFMRDIHKRLFAYRKSQQGDALEQVIAELARESRLLCLDELQVTDVTDAMILARLFEGLMDAGVAVVFTSNRAPRELYQGGLQRDQFLKFVALLEKRLPVMRLESAQDYRLAKLKAMQRSYVYPRNDASDDFLLESWAALTAGAPNEPLRIEIDGRVLRVDKYADGVAWLTFGELCLRPLGAGDYLELCQYCHTLLLQGIPKLTREDRNEARRFVTLIDALYDCHVNLIATAETPPEGIYEAGDGNFEFQRTVSRLIEMQSETYMAHTKE